MTTQPKLDLPVVAYEGWYTDNSCRFARELSHDGFECAYEVRRLVYDSDALSIITPLQEEVERLKADLAHSHELRLAESADAGRLAAQNAALIDDLRVATDLLSAQREHSLALAIDHAKHNRAAMEAGCLTHAQQLGAAVLRFEATIAGVKK